RGGRAAAAKPAGVGIGRRGCAVRRHQADRPVPRRAPPCELDRIPTACGLAPGGNNMQGHLRANLWLLGLTVLVCCVLYPLALWGVGQTIFPTQAQGSLVHDKDGKAVGSRLIGQPFSGDAFFQPRPSHAGKGYEANSSGASNWGANNYLLRDRVARTLGPIVKYQSGDKKGQLVAPDVVAWFRKEKPGLVAEWARAHPGLAQAWVKAEEV